MGSVFDIVGLFDCVFQQSIAEVGLVGVPLTADLPNTNNEAHVNHADQTDSTSDDPPHSQSTDTDQSSPDNHLHSVDHEDQDQQFRNVDQSQYADQAVFSHRDASVAHVEPIRLSRNADEENSDPCNHLVYQLELEPFHQYRNVDEMDWDSPRQLQFVDLEVCEDRVDGGDQLRNVDQVDSVLPATTSVDPTAPVDSVDQTKSASSSMSVIQICSIVGLAFISVAAVVYILRRSRHSKV